MNQYRDEYNRTEREVYWTLPRILFLILIVGAGFTIAGFVLGMFDDTAKVAQEQFGASALLQKYEWFTTAR